ncbi:MAG TPA: hypothetical protein VK589_25405 [Chryseolinea sp.]|nr:hypothetical protein [Chryseolinea sp.]
MNKMLLAIFCLILPFTLPAQEHEFQYYKNKKLVYLQGDEHNYEFETHQANSAGSLTTSVQSADGSYQLLTRNDQHGTLKMVFDSKNSLLATVFLTGEKKNSVLLPDGRFLQYKKVTNLKWSYLHSGKEVVTYAATQKDRRKRVLIEYHDSSFNIDAIRLICLDHGKTKLKGNPVATSFIAGVVFTTLLGAFASQN